MGIITTTTKKKTRALIILREKIVSWEIINNTNLKLFGECFFFNEKKILNNISKKYHNYKESDLNDYRRLLN